MEGAAAIPRPRAAILVSVLSINSALSATEGEADTILFHRSSAASVPSSPMPP